MEKPCFNATVLLLGLSLDRDDDWRLNALEELGYSEAEAHRLLAFVPSAFARPILERLGLTEFSDAAVVLCENGEEITFSLRDQPEFVLALSAARDHFERGTLPREAFEKLAMSSSEIDMVNRALNEGVDVRGGAVATAFADQRLCEFLVRR